MRSLGLATLLFLLFYSCGKPAPDPGTTAPAARMNVVLISIDTLRADALGAYGNKNAQTPVIDALARSGILFRRHLASVPLTLPSHATMLTGLLPTKTGIHDNNGYRLAKEAVPLAETLRKNGYRTAAFVSSVVLNHVSGLDRGFDTYEDRMPLQESSMEPRAERPAGQTTDRALAWLEQNANAPFFLFVHYYDPHAPYAPPPDFLRAGLSPYLGEVAYVDNQIGRLLTALSSVRSRTLIVLTGDHGEGLGEHDELGHGLFLYDSTLHVPLIVAGPSVPGGKVESTQTAMVDLAPTVLDAAGIQPPPGLDGQSLTSVWKTGKLQERPAIAETFYPMQIAWSPLFAIASGGQKFIEAPHPELYAIPQDPSEQKNLLPDQAALAAPLRDKIGKYRSVSLAGRKQESADPELEEQLKSLGYISGSTMKINPDSLPDPKDRIQIWKLFEQSQFLSMDSRNEEAVVALGKALKLDPRNAVLYDAMGRYLFESDPARAAAMWHQAIELDPRNHTYHHKLALCLQKTGNPEKALAEEELALAIQPDMLEALLTSGGLLLELNRPKEAADRFEKALQLDPAHAFAAYEAGVAWRTAGDFPRAEGFFQQALQLNPDLPLACYELGILKGRAGDYAAAETYLARAVSLKPDFSEALFNLAVIYERTGRQAEAVSAYTRFLASPRATALPDRLAQAKQRVAALQNSR